MTLSLACSNSLIATERLPLARRHQRRFVDEIGEVGAGKAGRAARDDLGIDIRGERHLAHVHFEDLLAADDVRVRHDDLPVEAARPQQRRVEHIRPVGRGDQDHALIRLEAVHLDEQLVQGLLALVIAAAEAGAAMPADRVDLVDEDDAGRVLLALLEHVAHAAGADADEHLDKIGARDREERHVRFAGDRAGEQGLAGAGRARPAARPSGSCRRAAEISAGPSGTRRSPRAPAWLRRCRRRPRR